MNNKYNDKILNLFVVVFIIIIIFYLIAFLINKTDLIVNHDKGTRVYNYTKGNSSSKNLDLCKLGCNRGVCKTKNSKNKRLCKYDFQCNYCKDRKTNNFYADLTKYDEILPDYDAQEELSLSQSEDLNSVIEENNEYIEDLNKKIMEYNNNKY